MNPPEVPTPGMAGGEKPNATASRSLLNSRFKSRFDGLKLFCPGCAIVPWLHGDEEERVIAGAHEAQEAEADDAGEFLTPGVFTEIFSTLSTTSSVRSREAALGSWTLR